MSLKLRLTLFYTLLVAVVLGVSGLALRLGLEQTLRGNLEASLREALTLAVPLIHADEGLRFSQEGELLPRLPPDLTLSLYHLDGSQAEVLGRAPPGTLPLRAGCWAVGGWQICGEAVPSGWLLASKPLAGLQESLRAQDRVLLLVLPGAVLLALGLGYLLAGQALAPVGALTRAARERSRRRAWKEPLPEPKANDELRALSQAFNGLLGTLGKVIEGERRFTQDAAHELRTPLTALLGRLEQAQEANQCPQVGRLLERARRSTTSLLKLSEKLLQLARAEAGQGLVREPVALNALAREEMEELEPLFAAKGLRLRLEPSPQALTVLGDRLALGLALRNLLENAFKFTPAGEVRFAVGQEGAWARLEISDGGPGIPQEALPHLFERFYQASVEHRQGGSGLGLALVAAIARWHGGEVSAANQRSGGARFTLRLPLLEAPEPLEVRGSPNLGCF